MQPTRTIPRFSVTRCLLVILMVTTPTRADQHPLDVDCRMAANDYIERQVQNGRDYGSVDTSQFYSALYNACILLEQDRNTGATRVVDVYKRILRDAPGDGALLLDCDDRGADSVRLDVVRKLGGIVGSLPLEDWMDDGIGGPARSASSFEKGYDTKNCIALLNQWQLRLVN